jgi:hypothetical protein
MLVADFGVVHSRRYFELIRSAGYRVVPLDTGRGHKTSKLSPDVVYQWPRSGEKLTKFFLGTRLSRKLGEFIVRMQLRRLVAKVRPDIVHVQWIDDKAWLLTKIAVSPLVLTAWGSDLNMTLDSNYDVFQRHRKAEAISKAALLIADSQDMIDIAKGLSKLPLQSALLPIGIDTNLFSPAARSHALKLRKILDIPEGAKVVLSPRAFRKNYGHDIIAKAFARATWEGNTDAYLVFKAYDCWDRSYINHIKAIASTCKISHRIRIIEEMKYEDLPTYYAIGDFAVNCPTMDAFPVTFLECLACQLPVLTRHLPAYDSLGVASYLRFTDAPTEDAFAAAISNLLSSAGNEDLQGMSAARAYVVTNFDERLVARELGIAYQRIREKVSLQPAVV